MKMQKISFTLGIFGIISLLMIILSISNVSAIEPILYESFDNIESINSNGGTLNLYNSVMDSSFERGVVENGLHTRLNEYVQYNISSVENLNSGTIEFLYKNFGSIHSISELDSNGGWSTDEPYIMNFVNNYVWIENSGQRHSLSYVDNGWHHIAMTWRCGPSGDGYMEIYLDGQPGIANTYYVGCSGRSFVQPLSLRMGKASWYPYSEAVFDELKVYNYVKTEEEILSDFQSYSGKCFTSIQCGTNGFIGNTFCQDNQVYQPYRIYSCQNPGQMDAYCSYDDINLLKETCTNGCSNGKCNLVPVKPVSTGNVKIIEDDLIVNNSVYKVKSIGYSPTPIGNNPDEGYDSLIYSELRARDFPIIRNMGANTIRTWGPVRQQSFLDDAWNNNNKPLRVIMGFWMGGGWAEPYNEAWREQKKQEFRDYVTQFKDHPAVLAWAIGNEENYFYAHGDNTKLAEYFSLVNEMAQIAYEVEGEDYHPVIAVAMENVGSMTTIGNEDGGAGDENLSYVDIWGINYYPGIEHFSNFFSTYQTKTSKPLILTEYGIDSYNQSSEKEYQEVQAIWEAEQWRQIDSSFAMGGSLMAYSDEYWKGRNAIEPAGTCPEYDSGFQSNCGYTTINPTSHPDGFSNEEYWGIISVKKNTWGNPDIVTPKRAYYTLQYEFLNPCQRADFNYDGRIDTQDFTLLKLNFGQSEKTHEQGDANADGKVDTQDFTLLKQSFGQSC